DDRDRSRGVGLRPSPRGDRQRCSARGQVQELPSVGKFHDALSEQLCNGRLPVRCTMPREPYAARMPAYGTNAKCRSIPLMSADRGKANQTNRLKPPLLTLAV